MGNKEIKSYLSRESFYSGSVGLGLGDSLPQNEKTKNTSDDDCYTTARLHRANQFESVMCVV